MDLGELFKKLTSGDIPTGALGGGGILALIIAIWVARRMMKFVLFIVGLALLACAVWWHMAHR